MSTTRRSFLTSLLAFASLPLLTKAARLVERPKLGYISVDHVPEGTRSGDWCVEAGENARSIPSEHSIQRANDIEGWYEHLVRVKGLDGWERSQIHHVKADIHFVYHGPNPRYSSYSR